MKNVVKTRKCFLLAAEKKSFLSYYSFQSDIPSTNYSIPILFFNFSVQFFLSFVYENWKRGTDYWSKVWMKWRRFMWLKTEAIYKISAMEMKMWRRIFFFVRVTLYRKTMTKNINAIVLKPLNIVYFCISPLHLSITTTQQQQ